MNETERKQFYNLLEECLKKKDFPKYIVITEQYLKREQQILLGKIPKKKKGIHNES